MGWVTEREQVLRGIVDRNCTLIGHFSDGKGNRCFWGTYLVEELGCEEKSTIDTNVSYIVFPDGTSSGRYLPEGIAPIHVIDRLICANDSYFDLVKRRQVLHQAITELIEEEATLTNP